MERTDFRARAEECRARADESSLQVARFLAEREQLRVLLGRDRRAAARRQVVDESIAWHREMSAKWNRLAEVYEGKVRRGATA